MSTVFKWVAPGESIQTALSTHMDALANSTSDTTGFSTLSTAIANETDLYQYMNLELHLATQASTRLAGAFFEVWISYALDGSVYGDDSNAAFSASLLAVFGLDAAVTARTLNIANIPIPPLNFKLYVRNKSGYALPANSSTLKYRRHNEQGV